MVHNLADWLNNKICAKLRQEFQVPILQKVLYIVALCSKYTIPLTLENTVQGVCITGEAVPEDPRFLLHGVGFNAIWLHQPVFDLIGTNSQQKKITLDGDFYMVHEPGHDLGAFLSGH